MVVEDPTHLAQCRVVAYEFFHQIFIAFDKQHVLVGFQALLEVQQDLAVAIHHSARKTANDWMGGLEFHLAIPDLLSQHAEVIRSGIMARESKSQCRAPAADH